MILIAVFAVASFGVGIFFQSDYHPIIQTTTETLTVVVTTTAPPPANLSLFGKASTLGFGTHATSITFESAGGFTESPPLNSTEFYHVSLPNEREYNVTISGINSDTLIPTGTCRVTGSFILEVGAGTQEMRMDWAC